MTPVAFGFVKFEAGDERITDNTLHQSLYTCLYVFCLREQNGKIDMTFFTHDCFHFTIKGHEELAKGLWNNMVNNETRCLYFLLHMGRSQVNSQPTHTWKDSLCGVKSVLTKGGEIMTEREGEAADQEWEQRAQFYF